MNPNIAVFIWILVILAQGTPVFAQSPGQTCVMGSQANLFVGKAGGGSSSKIAPGTRLLLKKRFHIRWSVEVADGRRGFVNADWMNKVCEYEVPAPPAPMVEDLSEPSDVDVASLVEITAALEVTKLAALSEGELPQAVLRQQAAKIQRVKEESLRSRSTKACEERSASYRVAVYDFELQNIPKVLGRVISDSLLAEIRKLEGISAIGMDEIREMLDFEAQRQALGCEGSEECMAEIAGALGVDEILTGSLLEGPSGRTLVLRRIDQRRAEVVHAVNKRLEISDGEEFLLAIGPAVEAVYPERENRPGTTRGVPKKVLLRLNPPPVSATITWSTMAAAAASLAVGGSFMYLSHEDQALYREGANQQGAVLDAGAFKSLEERGDQYLTVGNAGLIGGATLTLASVVMSFFTDWDGIGHEDEDNE